ncbi:capsular polysaccharide synthesis protein [Moraxella nasicaprae]|uniref:Capsular polysaccharide synthesis protein n=1 Tax=Moraxella nasicaprae TaxID=2904122 RepID=A0ABY6F4G4_9GAMM|nr:capsular polysaccharide synthesis protein [Moraxella nasicaprae]UXZ04975.1 capsular polysaccharide synthesis protein [Moraxella nasicaprae]
MANENHITNLDSNNTLNHLFCDCPEKIALDKCHRFPYRPLYFAFTPKKQRQAQKYQVDLIQKQQLANDWRIFLQAYFAKQLPLFEIKPKKEFTHQKIIWQYWGQGIDDNLPDIVKMCFKSVDKHKGDFIVIRLDDNNLNDYLELPAFINQKRKNPEFKPAFFADLLRLALLYHYGGVWLDATILLTAPIDEMLLEQDFFMFSRDEQAENQDFWQAFNSDYFGWHKGHHVNILNSFIIAKKGNEWVKDCLQILLNFWHTQNHIPHYFFFQVMFDVLQQEYGHHYQDFLKKDDTITHLLIAAINEPFDQTAYQQILSKTGIHKLTYIKSCKAGSYYERLRQEILGLKI